MIAGDADLEAIPLPRQGERHSMGIVIPHRDPASPVAESFFEIASSKAVGESIARSLSMHRPVVRKKVPA